MDKESKLRVLQSIVDQVPLVIGRLDSKGKVTDHDGVTLTKDEQKSYQPIEMVEKLVKRNQEDWSAATTGGQAITEDSVQIGDTTKYFELFMTPDPSDDNFTLFYLRDISPRKETEIALLECSEIEQRRIGEELHSSLGQELTAVQYMLKTLRRKSVQEEVDPKDFAEIEAHIAQTLENTRSIARRLLPMMPEGSFLAAVEDISEHVKKVFDVECEMHLEIEREVTDEGVATNLLRIIHEAILNSIRHGKATRIDVFITTGDENLLRIVDNGSERLPDATSSAKHSGMGLALMRYAAGIIGGRLSARQLPDEGFEVQCYFKIPEADQKPAGDSSCSGGECSIEQKENSDEDAIGSL